MRRKIEFMQPDTFENIIRENHDKLEFVSLNGYGEPLLHPELFSFLKLCRRYGVKTGVSTNCTLLGSEKAVAMLADPPDILTLAVDGMSPTNYEKVRVGAKFRETMANVHNFLDLWKDAENKPKVVLQCIYMSETRKEIDKFKHAFSRYGEVSIRIRQLTHSGLHRKDGNYRNSRSSCYWLWTEPMVLSDGTVAACCQDVNGQLALGNIKDMHLQQIWQNDKISRIRQCHATGNRGTIAVCRRCNMYQPGRLLSAGSMLLDTLHTNTVLPAVETIISRLRYRKLRGIDDA
jgi:radical SAM protein with 4Fe4S-binding SPASM domain